MNNVFEKELALMHDEKIILFTKKILNLLPDYFYHTGASSTGKYHPQYAAGDGGLVRHTKAAVRIAYEMLRNDMFKPFQSKADLIYAALILHDGCKHGLEGSKYTVTEHPLVVSELIRKNATPSEEELASQISSLIETHMGQWNYKEDWKTKKRTIVLEKPQNKLQNFVHLCDYLASRTCIEHNFEAKLSN